MRRLINWPYWPESTIIAGWQVFVVSVRSTWQIHFVHVLFGMIAAYTLVGRSIAYKMALRREYG